MPQVNEFTVLVSAHSFGAQGDGVNNDGPFIQAALDQLALFGGIQDAACYLEPGRYLILTPVTVPNGITITGAGVDTVILLGPDTATGNLNAFTVDDGDTAGWSNLVVEGPSVPGAFTVRFIEKLGTSGAIFLSSVVANNAASAAVRVPVGCRFVLENCAEVAEDYYPVTVVAEELTHLADALWTGGNWPRRIKGTVDPTAGAGIPASEGSIYQRFVAGAGEFWLKFGAGDTAWVQGGGGSAGTLQDSYNNGPPSTIVLTLALGGVAIRDGAPAVVGNLFEVTNNADTTEYLGVSVANGVLATGTWSLNGSTIAFVGPVGTFPDAFVQTADAPAGTSVVTMHVEGGAGAAAGGAAATTGGILNMTGGAGGAGNAAFNGADGGPAVISGGVGGAASTPSLAGIGGAVAFQGGTGGAGSAAVAGGVGGAGSIGGGLGGAGTAAALSGNGGGFSITGGDAGVSGGFGSGNGGAITATAGAGATGGAVTITGGASGVAATGGNIVLNPGNGATSGFVDVLIDDAVATVSDALRLRKTLGGAGAAGLGIATIYRLDNSASTETTAARMGVEWVVATAGAETAQFTFSALVGGVMTSVGTFAVGGNSLTASDAATVTVTDVLSLTHVTSGAAGTGYGTGLLFRGEDAAGGADDMGRISAAWTDATAASEDSIWRMTTRTAGAALAQVAAFENSRAIVPTAYQIGTEATTQWSVTVVPPTATYTVADTTFNHAFTQTTAAATGAHVFLSITPGNNTNQTLSTEIPSISITMSTKQWATGALVNQRGVRITSPTWAFVGASTITRGATLYSAAPIAGANATITSPVAAWFENNTAQTNTNADAILLTHQTSGTPAVGFGSGIQWQLPDSAGTLFVQGRIQCDLTAATATNPTSEFTFFTRASGGLVSAGTWSSISLVHPGIIRADASLRQGSSNQLVISTTAGQTTYSLAAGVVTSALFTYTGANSTSANAWIFRNATRTALTSEAIFMDFDAATNTMTFAAGTFALQRMVYFRGAVILGTAAGSTITAMVENQFDTPTASGANITFTGLTVNRIGSSAVIGPSGTTTTYSAEQIQAHTITYTVATGSTAACGVAGIRIDQITVAQNTGAGTLTITNGASLYISGAPLDGTGTTITNKYAIFVDAGLSRFDGNGTHVFEVPADATGNVTVATGRIPILTGGALKYLRYFDD